ncbi:hypothetical protein BAE30_03790 [Acidithiobacillus caldus]|jgi:hypothetical protein|uniref:Uncharacterized protein n=1 Tax=Acidithiobacillus caldus TaxID=33059 RepID=A0A1E7YZ45_9PROT|nr:hypothetical protein BAE30_03790 [Acidithiobacillus caldus]
MPHFFRSKESLPEELLARWDHAVAEYDRVLSELCGDSEPARFFLYNHTREKSALFWRLLNGKEPLPSPPPTSFSYPWYGVVEDPGPHAVDVWTKCYGQPLPEKLARMRGTSVENRIFLNECGWTVARCNPAAHAILEAMATEDGPAFEEKERLMADGPELILRYPGLPEYRLFVGRERIMVAKHHAQARSSDSSWIWTNAEIIDTSSDDRVEMEVDGWFLERLPGETPIAGPARPANVGTGW